MTRQALPITTPACGPASLGTDALPVELLARLSKQRREARRRQRGVRDYHEMVPGRGRCGAVPCDVVAIQMRQRYGVSVRGVQVWAKWLRELDPMVKRLLFGRIPRTFEDLPRSLWPIAQRRFELVQKWQEVCERAREKGRAVGPVTDRYVRRWGLSHRSLYRWARLFRKRGLLGLIDRRRFVWCRG